VATIVPKKSIDPRIIQTPPIICENPERGVSAMPAVENAAIPQYRAFPKEVIVVPSVPFSERYKTAENVNHKITNRRIMLRKGV
jgi:hypothetical protein